LSGLLLEVRHGVYLALSSNVIPLSGLSLEVRHGVY